MSIALTHIKTEKQLVPELRFKEFEGLWKKTTLGDLFTFKNGLNSDKEKYGSGTKFINVLDIIGEDVITYDSIIGKVEVTEREFEKNEVIYGDVLFQRSSETREEVGQANIYADENKSAVFGGFVIRGRKKEDYNPYFMNYLLKTSPARKEITTKSGGSTRYNVGQSSLSEVFVNLTDVPEQQKIASFLSAVDEKIQQLTKKKELLEQYKKGVMQQLFRSAGSGQVSGQLRFKDENGNDYPDWEEKTLLEVASFRRGSFPQPYGLPEWYDDKGVPFVQVYDVAKNMLLKPDTKQHISEAAQKQSVFVKKGTLVLTIQGSIGRLAKTQYDAYVDRTLLIFQSYKVDIDIDYFKYVVYLLFEIEKTKAPGGTIKTITKEKLSSFNVNIPCMKEQQKIATYLSSIDTKIESVNNQITQTQTFKKGLLQQMFV
jgi:type I restriction enzyme S subunit